MAAREPKGVTLTFTDDELDAVIAALVLFRRDAGLDGGYDEDDDGDDDNLVALAGTILARIETELPAESAGPAPRPRKGDGPHHATVREAIRAGTKLTLSYVDRRDKASARTIWPLELGHVGAGETIGAWCESRRDFRHFRLDRIVSLEDTGERYPGRRRILLARLRLDEMEQSF